MTNRDRPQRTLDHRRDGSRLDGAGPTLSERASLGRSFLDVEQENYILVFPYFIYETADWVLVFSTLCFRLSRVRDEISFILEVRG